MTGVGDAVVADAGAGVKTPGAMDCCGAILPVIVGANGEGVVGDIVTEGIGSDGEPTGWNVIGELVARDGALDAVTWSEMGAAVSEFRADGWMLALGDVFGTSLMVGLADESVGAPV